MSKQIVMHMWTSVIPDKMYESWIKRKMIKRGADDFMESAGKNVGRFCDIFHMDSTSKIALTKDESRRLRSEGWKHAYTRFMVSSDTMEIMNKEVGEWYKDVFLYVEEWLKKNKFIDLRKGSFRGGFCAVEKEDDTTKGWGAPLAGSRNKVCQIKEKFGRITVYFNKLNKTEQTKINRFAKYVEKKFDCVTIFC
jgi:hypothetical protein